MGNPVRFIRQSVLGLSQKDLAEKLGVEQSSVSRWERAGRFPSDHMPTIRALGHQARRDWSDTWFFEPPTFEDRRTA